MEEERFVSEVRAMERTLYRVARGYLRTWDECADAVQEALCKAWDKRKRVDESYFRPWLTRIVINECHNIGRRKKRLIPVAEPEREPAAAACALKTIILLLAPFVPHLAEELWRELGGEGSVFRQPWPEWDPALVEDHPA